MALTKEDLQAISELMDAKLEPVNNRLDEMATNEDLKTLRGEVAGMATEMADLKAGVAAEMADLKAGMATKEDLAGFATKEDLANFATKEDLAGFATKEDLQKVRGDIANLYQNHEKHMAIISEGLGHLNGRYAQLDEVEQTVDDHGNRIFALEQRASNG